MHIGMTILDCSLCIMHKRRFAGIIFVMLECCQLTARLQYSVQYSIRICRLITYIFLA